MPGRGPSIGRLWLLLMIALALAPGTWVRSPSNRTPGNESQVLSFDSLALPQRRFGEIEVAGAWHMRSPNHRFVGYSALVPLDDGKLLALTDGGEKMIFTPPGAPKATVELSPVAFGASPDKRWSDFEGATRDPATGTMWASLEHTNQIRRFGADIVPNGFVSPPEMHNWPGNSGPESITRLADGRFIVLAEGSPRWFTREVPGLLFPGDPLGKGEPTRFSFRPPRGYSPVDMATLPDGRVLILLRRMILAFPPRFEGKLMIADPAQIRGGQSWPAREIADLVPPLPMDNYEGLAIEQGPGGGLVLWLISDDNRAMFQRTLLLKLLWRPNEKARGVTRAPD